MKKILDLGCGTGERSKYFTKRGAVIGIDINSKNIEKAKKKFPEIDFRVMSAENLSFGKDFFDEVYAYDVLEHVDELDETLNEIKRVLKIGGKLWATIPYQRSEKILLKLKPNYFEQIGHKRILNLNEFSKKMKEKGFKILKVRRKNFYQNIFWIIEFLRRKDIANEVGGVVNQTKFDIFLQNALIFFTSELFQTKAKYFFPIWIITLPLGKLFDLIFPKTIEILAEKL